MLSRTLTVAAIALATLPVGAAAQTASSAVAAASKALGADAMTSITYSGTARNGSFGQSKAIGQPLGPVNNTRITAYMRAISFAPAASPTALVSRATGPINPSLIKETMVRREPDFDESDHGFATFSKLLEAMEREGLLKRQKLGGRQWYVVPPDVEVSDISSSPAPAEEEIPDPLD